MRWIRPRAREREREGGGEGGGGETDRQTESKTCGNIPRHVEITPLQTCPWLANQRNKTNNNKNGKNS